VAFWTFVTPASPWPRQFRVNWTSEKQRLSESANFALS